MVGSKVKVIDSPPDDERVIVELDAYAIADDHLVWKCSPGKTYRFYSIVRDAKVVFPDIRGLGDYFETSKEWDDEEVLSLIAEDRWSRELESREKGNQHKPGSEEVNSTDRTSLTFIKRLLFEAKRGDFVVVPADGYDKEVLFGEFMSGPSELSIVQAKDGEYEGKYVGRPVRWRKFITKRELKPELIDELHYRAAIFILSQPRAEDVYRSVLGNFVFRNRYVAEFRTEKAKFTPEDFAVVSTWLNGFDYLRHYLQEGDAKSLPESFAVMGLQRVPDDEATELMVDIQSPGEIFAKSLGPFALALMAMMPLAGCDSTDVVDNGVSIEMKSIGNATTECRIQVEDTVNDMVRTMSYGRLDEANCLSDRASTDARLHTGARLKNAGKRRIEGK